MASLSTDANGLRKIQFAHKAKRRTVYLGEMTLKNAKHVKDHIEALVSATLSQAVPDPKVSEWVASIPDWLAEKLAAVELIAPREKQQTDSTKLGEFIDAYLLTRTDIKPRTRNNLLQAKHYLVTYFGESKPLAEITPGDTDEWRRWLLTKLSENTVRRHCGRAKQLFRAALRKRLITENVFADMRDCVVKANKSREFFASRADADKIIAACPNNEWRLIFALARFGGLRTPSETFLLRWCDVNWATDRLLIRSPKTEHHEGKDSRLVPIFPELRPYLEAAWDQAADGAEFVITRSRDADTNLRTQLLRIIANAGLLPWPKLFQNLRSTRETELAETFPLHVVTAWLGNSQLVAAKHYLQVTDEHFQKATQNPTQNGAESSPIEAKPIIRPLRENEKAPAFPGLSRPFSCMNNMAVPPAGFEPACQD